ncbi:MAG: hypothetical protein KKB31_07130 [Nanoarchaeota archaeon]|nr:hypothetical protein [Nanoarchaeota archaeon]
MKVLVVLLMFFVLGSLLIVSNNNLFLSDSEDAKTFGNLWVGWIEKIYENSRSITGNLVKMNWSPE